MKTYDLFKEYIWLVNTLHRFGRLSLEEDEFKNKFRLIDFAILDGYRTGMRHNLEGNLLPFKREFNAL